MMDKKSTNINRPKRERVFGTSVWILMRECSKNKKKGVYINVLAHKIY